jgi:hypothetical protein
VSQKYTFIHTSFPENQAAQSVSSDMKIEALGYVDQRKKISQMTRHWENFWLFDQGGSQNHGPHVLLGI